MHPIVISIYIVGLLSAQLPTSQYIIKSAFFQTPNLRMTASNGKVNDKTDINVEAKAKQVSVNKLVNYSSINPPVVCV